jgi:HK97 family phage major capsid protein
MDALATKSAELHKERQGLKAFADEHTKDGALSFTADERERFVNWTKSIETLNDEVARLSEDKALLDANDNALKAFGKPAGFVFPSGEEKRDGIALPQGVKSLGELFVESEAFKQARSGNKNAPSLAIDLGEVYGKRAWSLGMKALFDTSAWTAQAVRLPEPVLKQFQTPAIADLFPQGRTSQNAVPYMEETTATNAAAGTPESGDKPESALELTPRTVAVKKIATSLPITSEAFDDEPMAESYVDNRLTLFVRMTEDADLMQGDGVDTVEGIYVVANTQTQAIRTSGGADTLDDIFKASMKVTTAAFVEATDLIIHPTDWQTVRLAKDQNDQYLLGPALSNDLVRPWGLRPIVTTAALAGHPVVLNPAVAGQIFRRSDVSLAVGWINEQFKKNQRTIVAEERLAFVIFRPQAIVKGDITS